MLPSLCKGAQILIRQPMLFFAEFATVTVSAPMGVPMPRNRLLARIDEELIQAQESLKFWRDQMLLLSESEFRVVAKRQVMHREADIRRLLETQEMRHGLTS